MVTDGWWLIVTKLQSLERFYFIVCQYVGIPYLGISI